MAREKMVPVAITADEARIPRLSERSLTRGPRSGWSQPAPSGAGRDDPSGQPDGDRGEEQGDTDADDHPDQLAHLLGAHRERVVCAERLPLQVGQLEGDVED